MTARSDSNYAPWVSSGATSLAAVVALAVAIGNSPSKSGEIDATFNDGQAKISFLNSGNVTVQLDELGLVILPSRLSSGTNIQRKIFDQLNPGQKFIATKEINYADGINPNRKVSGLINNVFPEAGMLYVAFYVLATGEWKYKVLHPKNRIVSSGHEGATVKNIKQLVIESKESETKRHFQ